MSTEIKKSYHENGKVELEVTYKNEKIDGPVKKYDDEGLLIFEGVIKDGKKEGQLKKYKNGVLFREEYYLNDKRNGTFIEYHDGVYQKISPDENIYERVIKYEENWKNDKKHGIQKEFFFCHPKEKRIKRLFNYTNGLINGTSKFFYWSGKLKEKRFYENGIQCDSIIYDIEGNVKKEYYYKSPSDNSDDDLPF